MASHNRRRNRRHRRRPLYTSIYAAQLTPAELGLIAVYTQNLTLYDEIWALRVLNLRLCAFLHPNSGHTLTIHQRVELTTRITMTNGRIARLLRLQHEFDQADAQAADPLARFLTTALHELGDHLSPKAPDA